MRPPLLLLCFLFLIAACGSKNKVPGNVLPPKKMEAILWDMMRADQLLADYVLNKDTAKDKDKESIKMYEQIFGFHKISKEEFERSFSYYRSNPERLKVIMDSIQNRKSVAPVPAVVNHRDTANKADTVNVQDTIFKKATIPPITIPSDTANRGKKIKEIKPD